jgi:hemerythrin-like domain-containing protein
LSKPEADRFRAAIRDLQSMYERHIRIEDNVIFPLAARLLTEQDKSAIADEMAGRRKVKLVGIGDGSHGL